MSPINRRQFLQRASHLAVGIGAASAAGPLARAKASANNRVTLAVMGVRGRGRGLAAGFAAMDDAHVACLCDVDQNVFARAAKGVEDRQGKAPKVVTDFRRILDDRSIDALVVATPDHWHAPATILACQAGKDVYVEKPASHTVREGRLMLAAARKHNRIVQVGTQSRSGAHYQSAVEFLRSGKLGRILQAKVINSQRRANIGHKPDGPTPAGVDYDLWLGPAPSRPFNPNRFHYNWHWFWDYGTGDIGNDGIHQIDIARWGLGVEAPIAVSCSGGKFYFDDDQQTPDTQIVTYEYPNCTMVYEMRIWAPYKENDTTNGNIFYGEEGYMIVDNRGWRVFWKNNEPGPTQPPADRDEAHRRNFLDCIRSRRRPNADIEQGHLSALHAHLGNIAYRTGRRLRFNPESESFIDDADGNTYLTKQYRPPFVLNEPV